MGTPLIAEDLLLLLLDTDSGALGTSYPAPVLGGALLIELAVVGAVEVEAKKRPWSSATVRAIPGVEVADPLLHAALAEVSFRERSATQLVGRLGKGARDDLGDRLADRGMLELDDRKLLGLIPRKRWPVIDDTRLQEVRRALRAVLVDGVDPDSRTGALIALLSAVDKAHKVVDQRGLAAHRVKKRAKVVAEGAWAAAAVRDVIAAATTAAATGAVIAGGAGGD